MANKMSQPITRAIAIGSIYGSSSFAPYSISVEYNGYKIIWMFRHTERRHRVCTYHSIISIGTYEQVLAKLADVHLGFMHRKGVKNG